MIILLQERDLKKSAKRYRKEGFIPGVIYGPDFLSTPVMINEKIAYQFFKFPHQRFEIEFRGTKYPGILQEIQKDHLTLKPIHFDIYLPSLTEKITTTIPIVFKGEEEILRRGYYLNKSLVELEIEGLLKDLPDKLEVDVSNLDLNESIYVKNLEVPNVKILLDPETPVASVIEQEISAEESLSSETNA
ncbi:MAG: 50S ribosomal protein L25 [Patescibacteria group bacterium]|nr:50S ribosomal protein L25 [Patescibacteria group bacterium]